MVRMVCSRLASDDEILNKSLKRKFGHRFTKVEVNDLVDVFACRGRRDIDDSMKEYEKYNRGLSDVDPDYLESFTTEPMWNNQVKKAVSFDADNIDPQYEMFWSSLKSDGNLCILEVSESNGLLEPIVYGADESDELLNNESDKLLNRKAKGKRKDVVIESEIEEKNRGRSAFTSLISSPDLCSNKDVFNVNSEGSDSLHRVDFATNGQSRYALRTNSTLIDSKMEESDNDSDYARFLTSNMICQDGPDRNMLVCEANKHGRDNANSRQVGKRYALRCSGNDVIKTNKVAASVVSRKNVEYEGCLTRLRHKGSKPISHDRPDLKVNHEAKHALCERDNDTSYRNGNITCFVNSEKSDDARVEGDDTSLCTGKISHEEINSGFRMELSKFLRQPYNTIEHKEFLFLARDRKKMDRHIDLRHGRAGAYSGKKHGKSYLDQHSGLKRKLNGAKNEYEELNLLRGFFFWLQNLTREDAFSPWRDKTSLALLPEKVTEIKHGVCVGQLKLK